VFAGVEVDVREDALLLHTAREGRIGEDDVVLRAGVLAALGRGERVVVLDAGAFELV
jgi:hypothetical protein